MRDFENFHLFLNSAENVNHLSLDLSYWSRPQNLTFLNTVDTLIIDSDNDFTIIVRKKMRTVYYC